jgi:hypothetical protein
VATLSAIPVWNFYSGGGLDTSSMMARPRYWRFWGR